MTRIENGKEIVMTPQEEVEFLLDQQTVTSAQTARNAEITAMLNQIKTAAQSAVGIQLTLLTANQIKALYAYTVFLHGGVDLTTGTIKPLNQWMNPNI